ncbi:hypothetical protein [Thermus filiformis]|uniref:Bioflim formation protein n=1 Tax=Thermus filiformis TaxID=276 RepID=A0A0A2WT89_THEFI|nr:hypothetical protein [Thermus filiformis]KGQ21982.1 hypothetical protein THFILI_03915 [Thermus filiformis]
MRKVWVLLVLLLVPALAQRAVSFRVSLPNPPGVGLGLEGNLEQSFAFRLYADLLAGPDGYLGGELLFKPDLGRFDRDLRGIRPYFGGGLGARLVPGEVGIQLALGLEVLLDARTGVFLEGDYFAPFSGRQMNRLVLGANLR